MSIAELGKLALVTLAYAAKDNSGIIGGSFDLVTLPLGGDFRLEHYQFAEVENMLCAFDSKMKAAFDELTR